MENNTLIATEIRCTKCGTELDDRGNCEPCMVAARRIKDPFAPGCMATILREGKINVLRCQIEHERVRGEIRASLLAFDAIHQGAVCVREDAVERSY